MENEQINILQKQLREEKSKGDKEKAVLTQQVELLTIQLGEASEREKQIKKSQKIMTDALNSKINDLEAQMRTSNVSQYQEIQNLEVAVQELESENENLKESMKNQAQNFQNERLKLNEELTTQKQLLVNKESEMVQIRENMLKMNTLLEIKQKDIENLDRRLPEIQRNEVTKQLSQLKKDYDSQLSAEQDKFIGRERILNQ